MKVAVFIFTIIWALLFVPIVLLCIFFFLMSFDAPASMTSAFAWLIRLGILFFPLLFSLGFIVSFRVGFTARDWTLIVFIVISILLATSYALTVWRQEHSKADEAAYNLGVPLREKQRKADEAACRRYEESINRKAKL